MAKGSKKRDQNVAQPKTSGWREFLSLIPTRNRAAEVDASEKDFFAVTVTVKKPWWLVPPVSWVMPMAAKRVVKLDPLGKMIWDACDDKHHVEDLVDMIRELEKLTFHEARVAVTQHLRELVRRGVLVLVAMDAENTPACLENTGVTC